MPGNDPRHTFIPKTATVLAAAPKKSRSFGLFFGITLVIFLFTALSAIGVYAYRAYLAARVANLSVTLERARAAFEPDTILALKRFNARTNTADALLARHIAPSVLFSVLEDLTVGSVRFSKFTYSFDGTQAKMDLSGLARSYSSVALQSDIFAKSPYMKNPVFSNLNLDKAGNVTFDVTVQVDPLLLLYKDVAARAEANPPTSAPPPVQPTQ